MEPGNDARGSAACGVLVTNVLLNNKPSHTGVTRANEDVPGLLSKGLHMRRDDRDIFDSGRVREVPIPSDIKQEANSFKEVRSRS